MGDNEETSREAWADTHLGDRSSLDLVGQQEELARAILALGKTDDRLSVIRPGEEPNAAEARAEELASRA